VVDVNSFLLMILYTLGSVLIIVLIVLGIKLINTINRVDNIIGQVEEKVDKVNRMLSVVDVVTDNLALVSDKIVDGVSDLVKRIFKKDKRKEEEIIDE